MTKPYLVSLLIIALILAGCTQQDITWVKTPHKLREITETMPTPTPTTPLKNTSFIQPEPTATEITVPTPSQRTLTPFNISNSAITSTSIETPAITPTPTITTPVSHPTEELNVPPTVRIVEPKDGQVIKSSYLPTSVQIKVEIDDNKDIDRVEFYIDGELKETTYSFHSTTAYLDEGVHTIKVVVYGNEGLRSEATVTVYVEKASSSHTPTPEPNEPPRVRIIEPEDGEVIQTRDLPVSVTIRVEASDDKFVDKIEFYVDGTLKGTTYILRSITVHLEEGIHTIHVVAYDNDGLTGEDTVSIRVEKIPEPTPNPFVDEYEDDDSIKQAKPILAGEVQHHKFDSSSDEDWLYFEASAGKKYTVEIVDSDITAHTKKNFLRFL